MTGFKERLQQYRSRSDAIYRRAEAEAERFAESPRPPIWRDGKDDGTNRSSTARLGDLPAFRTAITAFRARFGDRSPEDANRWRALLREQQIRICKTAPKSAARAEAVALYHKITEQLRAIEAAKPAMDRAAARAASKSLEVKVR